MSPGAVLHVRMSSAAIGHNERLVTLVFDIPSALSFGACTYAIGSWYG